MAQQIIKLTFERIENRLKRRYKKRKDILAKANKKGCLICISHPSDSGGYPYTRIDGESVRIHRLVYEQKNGKIPPKLLIRHTCDVRNCVNENHLIMGTHQDNTNDMIARNRMVKGEMCSWSKLTKKDVRKIRKLLNIGARQVALASKFKVTKSAIYAIKVGRNWK